MSFIHRILDQFERFHWLGMKYQPLCLSWPGTFSSIKMISSGWINLKLAPIKQQRLWRDCKSDVLNLIGDKP